jgi:hypothetical protein
MRQLRAGVAHPLHFPLPLLKLLLGATLIVLAVLGFIGHPGTGPVDQSPFTPPAPTAAARDQTVVITEAMLDDALTHQLVGHPLGSTPMGPATLQRVQTHLGNGQIQANGDARVGTSTVPVSISSRVDLENGKPVVTVQDARAAGVPVPDSTKSSVQQVVQSEVDQQVQMAQLKIKSISVADGKLVIIGTHQS